MEGMTIGKASRLTGVPAKTIRYYEEVGLIPEAERADNGYRVYDEVALHLLRFVKRARDFGFSMDDTGELLALWRDQSRDSADVKRIADARIAQIDRKIQELEAMKRALLEVSHRCHGDRRPDCPILETLAEEPS
jgi:Cu(I)-responsive transcriptional regulator